MHRVGYWKNCFRCRRRGEKPRGLFGRGGAGAHVQMMNGHGLALRPGRSGDAKSEREITIRIQSQKTATPTTKRMSFSLWRRCMKKRTTIEALQIAIARATTVLKAPRSM